MFRLCIRLRCATGRGILVDERVSQAAGTFYTRVGFEAAAKAVAELVCWCKGSRRAVERWARAVTCGASGVQPRRQWMHGCVDV